jgi:hypothetical protein
MRFFPSLALICLALSLSALLFGCETERSPQRAATEPSPTPTVTIDQLLVGAQDLPGCTLAGENSFFEGTYSRVFDCAQNDRLSYDIVLHRTVEEARQNQDNGYGIMDGARDIIRKSISTRPADQSSLRIVDATGTSARLGADQENLYCASYTDLSGSIRVTEYYGAFRHKNILVQYRSWADSGGSCDGSSRAQQNAHLLASKQLAKIKAAMP